MTTARNIVEQALKKINVLGRGQTLSNEEAQDGLNSLNNMLGSWSIEGGFVYTQTRETFSLTNATSYTIGSGGDFDTTRPFEIEAVYTTDGSTDYPVAQINQRQYSEIVTKTTTGTPDSFFYDNNSPLGNIFLYPIGGTTVTIYSRKYLTEFTNLDTDVTMPAGYDLGLVTNLGIHMAPEYGKEPSLTLQSLAIESKDNILTYNTRNDNLVSAVDDALTINNTYNIYSGPQQ